MDLAALIAVFTDAGKFVSILIGGITSAAFLFLVAAGLTLIFGVLGILNFAHGAIYMIGAYFTYYVLASIGNLGVALILCPIGVGIVGAIIERLFIRRVYQSPHLFQLLVTYALVLIFDDLVRATAGSDYRISATPELFRTTFNIWGSTVPSYYVFVIVITIIATIALWYFIYRTKWGITIRAAAADPEMLGVLGVNVGLVYTVVFGMGCLLAGIGAVLVTPMRSIYPGVGGSVLLESFIIVVIGGMGNLQGALLAALILGIARAFGVIGFPIFEQGFIFILMIIILLLRPQGLLGRAES